MIASIGIREREHANRFMKSILTSRNIPVKSASNFFDKQYFANAGVGAEPLAQHSFRNGRRSNSR